MRTIAHVVPVSLLWLLASSPAWAVSSTVVRHVLPAGQEAAVEALLDPGAAAFGGGCRVQDIAVREDRVHATYDGATCRFSVHLSHGSVAPAGAERTARFAVAFEVPAEGGRLPDEVRAGLLARVRSHEGAVRWRELHPTADLGQWGDEATQRIQDAASLRLRGEQTLACALLLEVARGGAAVPAARRLEAAGTALACEGQPGRAARSLLTELRTAWSDPQRAAADGADAATDPALIGLLLGDEGPLQAALSDLQGRGEGERACAVGVAAASAVWGIGRPDVAVRVLATLLAGQPGCVAGHVVRLRAAQESGRPEDLNEAERAALEALAADVEVLFTAGLARAARGETDAALSLLERAFAVEPQYPGLLGKIGSVVALSGCPDERMAAMEARSAARSDDWVALYVRSACAHYRREYARCVEGLERVRGQFPNEPRIYIYLGMTYFLLGQQDRAEELLRLGESARPQDPDYWYVRSEVRRARDLAGSIADAERYLRATHGGRELAAKRQRVERVLAALKEGRVVWSQVVLDEVRAARGAVPADMEALEEPGGAPGGGPEGTPGAAAAATAELPIALLAGVGGAVALFVVGFVLVRRRKRAAARP
jgi:tetratricopeptide (TPR) repeat protein